MPTFTPPTYDGRSGDYFFGRYTVPVGISVVKENGHYQQVLTPWLGEVASLTEGVDWFQGGRVYTVTPAVASALNADGFTTT